MSHICFHRKEMSFQVADKFGLCIERFLTTLSDRRPCKPVLAFAFCLCPSEPVPLPSLVENALRSWGGQVCPRLGEVAASFQVPRALSQRARSGYWRHSLL